MRQQWHPVYDEELGNFTLIAPRTGHLIVTQNDYRKQTMGPWVSFLLGASQANMGNETFFRADILDIHDPVDAPKGVGLALFIKLVVNLSLRIFPLSMAIAIIDMLFPCSSTNEVDVEHAIKLTANAFGRRSRQDCLPVSLCRFAYLRHLKMRPKIMLGTHVPTEKMHAWIQVGDRPVLECPDVLVHYQTCVSYF